jgi:hypothetical protein
VQGKGLQLARGTVVFAFLASLLAGMFLPVYSDEIGWRFQERAGFDGVDKMFSDLCGLNTLARPPWFMMPARHYSSLFNTLFADPFYVRLSGVGYAMIWVLLLIILIGRITNNRHDRSSLTIIGLGLMSLGLLPLILVWSRPEQPILLAATAALVIASRDYRSGCPDTTAATSWRRSILILLLGIIAISYHLKGIIVIPLFLTCLISASRGRSALVSRLVTGSALIGVSVVATQYWVHRFQCPGDPILAARFVGYSMGAALTGASHGGQLVPALLKIFSNADLLEYIGFTAPSNEPMSDWLERNQVSFAQSTIWFRGLIFAWMAVLILAMISLTIAAGKALRQRKLDPKIAMALVIFASAIGWSATQITRNVYEASFVLPLVMMAALFALAAPGEGRQHSRRLGLLATFLGLAAISSQILVVAVYAPSLARAYQQQGYIEQQPYSLAVFGYERVNPDIIGAARLCHITAKPRANALLVDDLTYFAFMNSYRPQHRLGVLSVWNGTISDPVGYLRSRKSDGIIVGCRWLTGDLASRARRQGEFCCLGPPNW